jgi:hypothetical protein
MTTGDYLRLAAGLAAVALIAAPAVMAALAQGKSWLDSRPAPAPAPAPKAPGVSVGDMRVVLDLAMRLKGIGCTAGVELCKQLLDVMMTPKEDV